MMGETGRLSGVLAIALTLAWACGPASEKGAGLGDGSLPVESPAQAVISFTDLDEDVRSLVRDAIESLAEFDLERLSHLVHPIKGVRFSPEAFVDETRDQIFLPDEIRELAENDTIRSWGAYDGSGEPIDLGIRDYFEKFVYDGDFANAGLVAVNRRLGISTTIDNVAEVYPAATVVEYYLAGTRPDYEGMDWQSLRLVVEEHGGGWFLVGIVHDQWSI